MRTGIKALTEGEPSDAYLARLERQIGIIRVRYERWMRRKYKELLLRVRKKLLALDDLSEENIAAIGLWFSEQRKKILIRYMEQMYPIFAGFIEPDDADKSAPMMEVKFSLTLSALAWIRETVGNYIRVIDGYEPPLQEVQNLAWQAQGDTVRFKELMDKSAMWSTTGCTVRSRRIAVTETTMMLNQSMDKTSEELAMGRKRVKTWHTSGMRNVRDAHDVMDGVTIPAEDFFELRDRFGGVAYMKFPGDNSMHPDAGLVVNCHCFITISYLRKRWSYPDIVSASPMVQPLPNLE